MHNYPIIGLVPKRLLPWRTNLYCTQVLSANKEIPFNWPELITVGCTRFMLHYLTPPDRWFSIHIWFKLSSENLSPKVHSFLSFFNPWYEVPNEETVPWKNFRVVWILCTWKSNNKSEGKKWVFLTAIELFSNCSYFHRLKLYGKSISKCKCTYWRGAHC